jgi:fructosamine-3-kinase
LRDAGLSVLEMRFEPAGRAHHVFQAETTSGTLFVKVSGSPRPRFATEVAALRALRRFGIAGPTLEFAFEDVIATRTLATDGEPLRSIGPDDFDAWADFGRWLAELHSIDPSGHGLRYDTDPLPLEERLAHSLEGALGRVPARFQERAERLVARLAESSTGTELACRFVHRDLRADNILVSLDGAFVGVVDFEHAAGAPPAWDLVKALHWNAPNRAAREAFSSEYGDLGDDTLWCEFEALMLLASPKQSERYGEWAESLLES